MKLWDIIMAAATAKGGGAPPPAAPVITDIPVGSGGVGDPIEVDGTGFIAGSKVQLNDHGSWVDFDNIVIVSDTQITADIPNVASSPSYPVRVHNDNGDSNTDFTIEVT